MHSLSRLCGHGLVVVPFAPFVARRIGDGLDDRIAVEHRDRREVLDPRALDAAALDGVAEVGRGCPDRWWCIEFGRFSARWPNHFALASSQLEGVPFELWGAHGALIMPQGPFAPPPALDRLAAPGQSLIATGSRHGLTFAELGYEHEQHPWRQRHTITAEGFVVSAQAPESIAADVFSSADALARDLRAPGVDGAP